MTPFCLFSLYVHKHKRTFISHAFINYEIYSISMYYSSIFSNDSSYNLCSKILYFTTSFGKEKQFSWGNSFNIYNRATGKVPNLSFYFLNCFSNAIFFTNRTYTTYLTLYIPQMPPTRLEPTTSLCILFLLSCTMPCMLYTNRKYSTFVYKKFRSPDSWAIIL